jgi:CRISPR-associated protein (TIGR03985 family)
MPFPTITALEELVPELARLANTPKSNQTQIDNFSTILQNAARLWTIERSLYDYDSDFFVDIEQEWFNCITWSEKFWDKIPDVQNKNLEYFLLGEYTTFAKNQWQQSVIKRYQINSKILYEVLSSQIFQVTNRTLRNNFKQLSKLARPRLKKLDNLKGKYKKNLVTFSENNLDSTNNNDYDTIANDLSNFLNDGISTIAELLISKINGEQRLFLQTEYVASENIQYLAADWADNLRELWKQDLISPIQIKYRSASQNTINSYVVYPVALHYYQRAYYLYAVGETPTRTNSQTFQWYSYRLERILFLKELTWNFSDTTKLLKTQIYPSDRINYCYTPTYIQKQLELAYGLSFYRQTNTMLLRFDRDYYQRQIKDTIRHSTFEKIADLTEVRNFIIQQLKSETNKGKKHEQEKLLAKVEQNCEDAYYKLRYRVDDNDVLVRLRSWGSNVEVILPWDLRQQMKQELEKACNFYEL